VLRIQPDGVLVRDSEGERLLPADSVIVGLGQRPRNAEAQALADAAGDVPVFVIGDAVAARRVGEAVTQAYRAAMSIT